MSRKWSILAAISGCLLASNVAWGQVGLGQSASSAASQAGSQGVASDFLTGGAGSQGSRAGGSTNFQLGSRFSGNFDRFTTGSQALGQTTAGAGAATSGMMGQGTNGSQMGRAGGIGGLGGLGGIGGMGGLGGIGGMGGLGGMGGMGGLGRGGMNQMQGGAGAQASRLIRTRIRVGFQPRVAIAASTISANNAVTRILDRAIVSRSIGRLPIKVEMEGRTAVLKGTVESDHDRGLAERLAMLEPGISDVRNELTVGPAAPKDGN